MKITVRLPGDRYSNYPFGVIAVGTPLTIFLESELILIADYTSPAGWCERLSSPQVATLTQLHRNCYAFCGQIKDIYSEHTASEPCHHTMINCTLPINLIVADLPEAPETGSATPPPFAPDDWVAGIAHLLPLWEEPFTPAVGEPVRGVVRAIDRLVMRPGPGFASFRAESELSPLPIEPDIIYLTLDIMTANPLKKANGNR